jgi:hypothetical protein
VSAALWAVAGLLTVTFLGAGLLKLTQPKDKLAASGQGWVEDFSAGQVRLIGTAEVLGALGLVLPPLVDVAPILAPIAALGLALLMAGAAVTHARRRELLPNVAVNLVLLLLAAFVAWGRFGPYAF